GLGGWVEVAELERHAGDTPNDVRVVDHATEDAGSALGCLVEELRVPNVGERQRRDGEFAVLEVELGLDRVLERSLERGKYRGIEVLGRAQDHGVSRVVDVGDDALDLWPELLVEIAGIAGRFPLRVRTLPLAALDVESVSEK